MHRDRIHLESQRQYDPLSDSELRERVAETLRTDEASAAKIIAIYRKNQPKQSNLDIYLILASDASTRAAAITQAERKSALGKAPVYISVRLALARARWTSAVNAHDGYSFRVRQR